MYSHVYTGQWILRNVAISTPKLIMRAVRMQALWDLNPRPQHLGSSSIDDSHEGRTVHIQFHSSFLCKLVPSTVREVLKVWAHVRKN